MQILANIVIGKIVKIKKTHVNQTFQNHERMNFIITSSNILSIWKKSEEVGTKNN